MNYGACERFAMRKRLRKKKKLGEFREFGFRLVIPSLTDFFEYMNLFNDLVDFFDLELGFALNTIEHFDMFINVGNVTKGRWKPLSIKESIVQYYKAHGHYVIYKPLMDVWHEDLFLDDSEKFVKITKEEREEYYRRYASTYISTTPGILP